MKPHTAFLLVVPFAVVLTGCQSARMAVPSSLAGRADVYPCRGRNAFSLHEDFAFSPYRVTGVRRGWKTREAWGIAFFERSRARQRFEFTLEGGGGRAWAGQAATGVRQTDLKDCAWGGKLTWGISRESNFVVRIGPVNAHPAWTLILAEESADLTPNGWLSNGTTRYRIQGTRELAGSPMPLTDTSGFLIYRGNRPVAAVDLVNAGAVSFDPDLPPSHRQPLATAAAALLLYRDIGSD